MTTPPHQQPDPYQQPDTYRRPDSQLTTGARHDQPAGYWTPGPVNDGTPSAVTHVIGAVAGFIGVMIALSLLFTGGERIYRSVAQAASTTVEAEGLLLALLGVALLSGVVVAGRWAPAAPLVPGVPILLLGLIGMLSVDFTMELYDLVPEATAGSMMTTWMFTGAMLTVGALLVASGVGAWIGQRAMRTRLQ